MGKNLNGKSYGFLTEGILGAFVLFLILSCGDEPKKNNARSDAAPVPQTAGQKMMNRLNELYASPNPEDVIFLNSARAAIYKSQADNTTDGRQKTGLMYLYCVELLNGGKTNDAIAQIEQILNNAGAYGMEINEATLPFYDLLGLAYIRLGEQDNCLHNHTGASCIIPLDPSAVHKLKTGSSKAAEIYKRILEKDPDNLNATWLLNVAYMTLGEYPQNVPAKWRLPESAFASKGLIPKFENIATLLGIDRDGYAGGVCVEDFNNDGYSDIVTSSWGLRDQVRFYVNHGDGTFMDHTESAGLKGITGGLNIIHADYNNDGFKDVLILRGAWLLKNGNHPNSLLKNNGNGTFEDVTEEAGIYSEHPTQTAGWADINLDGNLDLFIGNESGKTFSNPCEMYINNGDGTFTNMAEKLGLNFTAYVKGCAWGDVDRNGLPDLYVSVLDGNNRLYMNRGGTGLDNWKFEEVGEKAGVQKPQWSFPTWFFDYDNDGFDDIFVSSYEAPRFKNVGEDEVLAILGKKPLAELPRVYHNRGNGTFEDVTVKVGINRPIYGMGSNFGDINNDGYLDFYIGTGVPDLRSIVPNRMYLNQKGKFFADVTYDGGFGHLQKGHGVGFADFDHDGDLDVYETMGGAYEGDNFRNALYENPGNNNSWVVLELEGTQANRCAIGAVIKIVISDGGKKRTIFRTIGTGGSFGSSSLQEEIGLGQASIIESLEIRWPDKSRTKQSFSNVVIGKKYHLKEGEELTEVEYKPFKWQRDKAPAHHHHG